MTSITVLLAHEPTPGAKTDTGEMVPAEPRSPGRVAQPAGPADVTCEGTIWGSPSPAPARAAPIGTEKTPRFGIEGPLPLT